MKKPFFRYQAPPEGWTAGQRIAFWGWQYLWVVLSSVGLGYVSLLLATGPYPLSYMQGYVDRPVILVMNLLPVAVLGLLLYGLTRRAALGYLLNAVAVLGLSAANYFKLMFRDDPLLAADFTTVREAANMLGRYRLFVAPKLAVCLAAAAAGFVFLLVFVCGRPPRGSRLAGTTALLAAAGCLLCYVMCTDSSIYEGEAAYYDAVEHRWSSTEQYIARGFVYPFLYSTNSLIELVPADYRAAGAAALLDAYQDTDIPDGQKVNLMCIMLEAYNDFTKFGVPELAQDVYEVWHQLEAEGYSGNLVTNIFAGGTVDTERAFLSGYSSGVGGQSDFRAPTNSYVWYFREQGYYTDGLHPSRQWFYNRQNVNSYLGFHRYLFMDNYFNQYIEGDTAPDSYFFAGLLNEYRWASEQDKPYFNFSVSYQGHGPYNTDICWWGDRGDFVVDDGTYTDAQQYILDNYFGSIMNTNQNLKKLTDYFRADDKPVVLVLFGDHNPWMGEGGSVYKAMGVDFDLSTAQGFLNYYSTSYIIWANEAAKQALGSDFQGAGPDISPCFLMNEVFRLCGWKGPAYMQAVEEVLAQVPVQSSATNVYFEDGALTPVLSPEGEALVKGYNSLQYYYRHHFRYGDVE